MLRATGIAPLPSRKRSAPEDGEESEDGEARGRGSPIVVDLADDSGNDEEIELPSTVCLSLPF